MAMGKPLGLFVDGGTATRTMQMGKAAGYNPCMVLGLKAAATGASYYQYAYNLQNGR